MRKWNWDDEDYETTTEEYLEQVAGCMTFVIVVGIILVILLTI